MSGAGEGAGEAAGHPEARQSEAENPAQPRDTVNAARQRDTVTAARPRDTINAGRPRDTVNAARPRADIGFGATLDTFDPADWQPAQRVAQPRLAPEDTRRVAEAAGFHSREVTTARLAPQPGAGPAAATQQQRRRRTGRNVQLNLKARPDTIAAFCAVADAQGWGLGETLEHAVALLQRDYNT